MLSRYFVKPRPIPFLMSAFAVILLFGLGTWQLQRLAWKEALIAQIEQAAAQPPLNDLPDDEAALMAKRFHLVTLEGNYLPDQEFHLAARYFRSQLGYSVLNLFELNDGRIVVLNRGWVPAARKSSGEIPPAPEGTQSVVAQIRTSNERNPFTPPNQPEQNVWFGRDVTEIAAFTGKNLMPITLDVVGAQDVTQLPIPSDGEIRPRNDHLGYALTWYGVGLSVLIISLVYHRRRPSGEPGAP